MAFTASDWGRGVPIDIDNTLVSGSGSHTDVIVHITLSNIPVEAIDAGSNSALNGGGDLRFSTDINGATQLPMDIVAYVTNASAPSRQCLINVLVPSVSTSADTTIHMFYKKAAEVQPAVGAAFGRDAVFVDTYAAYHLGSVSTVDRSGNSNTLSSTNAPSSSTNGELGEGSSDFDGSNDDRSTSSNFNTNNIVTMEMLFSRNSNTMDSFGGVIATGGFDTNDGGLVMNRVDTTSVWTLESFPVSSNSSISETSAWAAIGTFQTMHITSDRGSTKTRFYVDGSALAAENTSHTRGNSSSPLFLGEAITFGDNAAVDIELVIMYDRYLDLDYVATRDNAMRDSENFTTAGTPFTPTSGGRIMSSLAGSGGLAYAGGIAGRGGGLAG